MMSERSEIEQIVAQLRAARRDGDGARGRELAAALRDRHPASASGWLWGARFAEDPNEMLRMAQQAAFLEPGSRTDEALRIARERCLRAALAASPDATPAVSAASRVARLGGAASTRLILVLLMLVTGALAWIALEGIGPREVTAGPLAPTTPALALKAEAQRHWAAGMHDQAIDYWRRALELDPGNLDIRESLAQAYLARSTGLLEANRPDEALPHLEAARELVPDELAILNEQQALLAYLAGRDAVAARDWEGAIAALTPLYRLDPTYLDVESLLAIALEGQQQTRAIAEAERARSLSASRGTDLGRNVREVLVPDGLSELPAQSSLPLMGVVPRSDKHIVVSINAQRMYVYEGGQLIWNWVASTGEIGRPTVPGRYRIQSKIENARSNVWSLWMPYWQGIYWAGSVENGIHGQVTFDSGGRLWEGYLGTRITYGCVMISDEHAALLFNWTEMGTPVSIHWDWDPGWSPNANGDPI